MTADQLVLVIGHTAQPSLEVVGKVARNHRLPLRVIRPVLGELLPPLHQVQGIIVLGGPQSAYDAGEHPYLADEKEYIASAYAAAVLTLAICLGSHLAAEAVGGTTHAGETGLEFGFIDVKAINDGGEELEGRFFSFHSDTMRVPPWATVLAVSDRYVQAWRSGSVLAVQFHPDLDPDGIATLLAFESEKLAAFGVNVGAIRRELRATDQSPGERVIARWFASLRAVSSSSP